MSTCQLFITPSPYRVSNDAAMRLILSGLPGCFVFCTAGSLFLCISIGTIYHWNLLLLGFWKMLWKNRFWMHKWMFAKFNKSNLIFVLQEWHLLQKLMVHGITTLLLIRVKNLKLRIEINLTWLFSQLGWYWTRQCGDVIYLLREKGIFVAVWDPSYLTYFVDRYLLCYLGSVLLPLVYYFDMRRLPLEDGRQ